jgi:uncharacterized protein with PhoU and TrkA domain
MLSEAKDASELMVDVAYAALFFGDPDMAEEVVELDERLDGLVHNMREVCILAARSPHDAEQMSSVLHVITAMERIGDAAVDISRIVTHRLGIPAALVADLAAAEEVSHRVRVREDSALAGRALADAELPVEVGMRVVSIRRGKDWIIDPDGDEMLLPDDVLILRGPPAGIADLRELAGAPEWRPPTIEEDPAITDLDRAIDVLVEMKNVSEVAVGLAYSALLFNNRSLAAEVGTLEARSDILHDELESWVLRAAPEARDPDALRGLLRLGAASEHMCDAARDMTWYVEQGEPLHPVVQLALEETEETSSEVVVERGSQATGRSLKELRLETETGMFVLAVQRGSRWIYRPRARFTVQEGDRLISVGPEEGEEALAELTRAPIVAHG